MTLEDKIQKTASILKLFFLGARKLEAGRRKFLEVIRSFYSPSLFIYL